MNDGLLRFAGVLVIGTKDRITKLLQTVLGGDISEANDLHRDGTLGSELRHSLRSIHNDDELTSEELCHLLAEEGASSSLGELEIIINLIRSVDGEINLLHIVDILEGNTEALCLVHKNRAKNVT